MNPLTRGSIAFALLLVASQTRAPAQEHPDRVVQPGVPQGKVTSGQFADSKLYPGTKRDFSVYVPAQYKADEPAALMVFMDGGGYANPKGGFRVPVVFDNLIHQKAMPVTIAVFVDPGHRAGDDAGSQGPQQSLVRVRLDGRSLRARSSSTSSCPSRSRG